MSVIRSGDVINIIRKSLHLLDSNITEHCEIVAYLLYKMLQYENRYTKKDLQDYAMLGLFHDIGVYRTEHRVPMVQLELKNVWEHSIYGYLFLRYLSPLQEKSELILYHHLNYNKYALIKSRYLHAVECLNFADKMDVFLRMRDASMPANYFSQNRNITFSSNAQQLFLQAEQAYGITKNLKNGSYHLELDQILMEQNFSETHKQEFLQMLIYTIDFRSEFTVLHTLGTTTFALELGALMNLSRKDLYNMYYGALLHDIGKMIIPTAILESPRKLSEDEMTIMKSHVLNTEAILRGLVDNEVLELAIRHHEKIDGSGYPRGLKGDVLTRPQRIIAVADILSALYQKRSYKDSFDNETIKEILAHDAANNKLCPEVVGCALKNFDRIMKNFENKKEATMGTYLTIKEQNAVIYDRFRQFDF